MRVLHFGKHSFIRKGGIEHHIEVLTRALAARGVDVTVLSYDRSRTATTRLVDGVRVEPVPVLLNFSSQPIAPALAAHARRLAREQPFDVVHQHWPDPLAHLAASTVPGRPAQVVSWHTDILQQRVLGPLYQSLAPIVLSRPDAVIGAAQSNLKSEQLDRFAPPELRHTIPFGVETHRFSLTPELQRESESLRQKYGGIPIVFALGRHVYYKGFEVLIQAMAHVPALLLLGGEGPLTPRLREQASSLSARVEFTGAIPDAKLPSYFHACDVFCLPSIVTMEAFGFVQAEAMACGKPVVNTALGNGVNELAPHQVCALTVPPGDDIALAEALCDVLRQPALAARLGAAGHERVHASFTVEAMVNQTLALYHELVDSHMSTRRL